MSILNTFNKASQPEQLNSPGWTADPGQYVPGHVQFARNVMAPIEGIWQEGFVKAGRAATAVSGGIYSLLGQQDIADELFESMEAQKAYWDSKRMPMTSTTQQVLYGVGGFAGKMWAGMPLGGPIVGGAITEGIGTAVDLKMEGADNATSIAQGMWKGATFYTAAAMPNAIAAPKGLTNGWGLTGWRLGYGTLSNVGVGVIDRAGEKLIYQATGDKARAEAVTVFDPLAMTIDVAVGTAMGGAYRFNDWKMAKSAAAELRAAGETDKINEAFAQTAANTEAKIAEIESAVRAKPYDEATYLNEKARAEAMQKELADNPDLQSDYNEITANLAKYDKAVEAEAKYKSGEAFTADEKAYLDARAEAGMMQAMDNMTVAEVDAAMVAHSEMRIQDTAAGIPIDGAAMQAHQAAFNEAWHAMNEGRMPDPAILRQAVAQTVEDPRLEAFINQRYREFVNNADGFEFSNVAPVISEPIPVALATPEADYQTDLSVIESGKQIPDDALVTIDGNPVRMADLREQQRIERETIDDETNTVKSLFSCLIGGV